MRIGIKNNLQSKKSLAPRLENNKLSRIAKKGIRTRITNLLDSVRNWEVAYHDLYCELFSTFEMVFKPL